MSFTGGFGPMLGATTAAASFVGRSRFPLSSAARDIHTVTFDASNAGVAAASNMRSSGPVPQLNVQHTMRRSGHGAKASCAGCHRLPPSHETSTAATTPPPKSSCHGIAEQLSDNEESRP